MECPGASSKEFLSLARAIEADTEWHRTVTNATYAIAMSSRGAPLKSHSGAPQWPLKESGQANPPGAAFPCPQSCGTTIQVSFLYVWYQVAYLCGLALNPTNHPQYILKTTYTHLIEIWHKRDVKGKKWPGLVNFQLYLNLRLFEFNHAFFRRFVRTPKIWCSNTI